MKYQPDWSRTSTSTGYRVVFCPEHPRAWKTGYVYVHTIVAEQKIGRLLRPNEVVHHLDKNKFNNSPENIQVTTRSEHSCLHSTTGQTIVDLVCAECGVKFPRRKGNDPVAKGYKNAFCSRTCSGKSSRRKQLNPRGQMDKAPVS